ncbi:hypothetical protein GCM10009555_073440 [Acrocarpospora macrocephala]|uniref:Uncharacterized protein n=1 Tax=Acrocarpospora macrocephala TaxID=150177 RepID=A0A5M3X6L8_9ACTN|nr:hypothetical protein Amac_098900 [Acrocarpospora macrocephala]
MLASGFGRKRIGRPSSTVEDGRRGSAIGWGGQPFCFPVQGLDEDEFQVELGVDKAVQDVH